MSKKSLKTLGYGAVVAAAAVLGIHTASSQNVQVKTWANGDTLTAADLNDSFAALQAGQGASASQLAWTGSTPATQVNGFVQPDGHVATVTFTSPVSGFAYVTANYQIRLRNTFDSTAKDCSVESLLATTPGMGSCTNPASCTGYASNLINSNLPTQMGGGAYLGITQVAATVLPVTEGDNTIYLNGRTNCAAAVWGAVTINALYVKEKSSVTVTMP
ncbi:MAG: hypothetical protein JWN04_2528 [Myxococcaceae bacterium]|nr:hypothetical protein [Myxococcaceae bacterium]